MYKSLGSTVNEIYEKQITVSLFRDIYPTELFKYLQETGREIKEEYQVHYVKGNIPFDTQIVVMK